MKVSLVQQIQLTGLTLAVATLSYLPNLAANAQEISPITDSSQPTLVANAELAVNSGSAAFVNGTGHTVTGGARIVEEAGKRYLEFDADFRTDSGPDLFVLLHREAVPTTYAETDYVNLGRLQRVARTQRYEIPAEVDLAALNSAVIWCRQFDVTFGYATL